MVIPRVPEQQGAGRAEQAQYGITGDMAARGDVTGRGFRTDSGERESAPAAPAGQYVAPSGQTYSQQDLERTAREHGVTVEEVIERAGLRPADR